MVSLDTDMHSTAPAVEREKVYIIQEYLLEGGEHKMLDIYIYIKDNNEKRYERNL